MDWGVYLSVDSFLKNIFKKYKIILAIIID